MKRNARDYADNDSEDDDEGSMSHDSLAKKAKRETENFIREQFQLRKNLNAARELEKESQTQITRVHQPQATSVKVAGLKIAQRENYLTSLADALQSNSEKTKDDKPRSALFRRDFESLAADIEYECFSKQKVSNMYRHAVAKEVSCMSNFIDNRLNNIIKDFCN